MHDGDAGTEINRFAGTGEPFGQDQFLSVKESGGVESAYTLEDIGIGQET